MKNIFTKLLTAPLAVAAIYGATKLYTGFGFSTSAEILTRFSVFFIAGFCLYVIFLLLKNKSLATFATWTMYSIAFITIASVLYMGFGYLQEVNEVTCRGFFGTESSCVENRNLVLHVTLLSPFILVPLGLASLVGIQQQIEKSYRKNER